MSELARGLDAGVRSFTFLKARQLGVTTISLAIDIFWLFLHPGIHGVLVSDNEGNRDKFRLILRQYSRGLPPGMRYDIKDDNKAFMSWQIGDKLSVLDFLVAGKRKGSSLGNSRAYRFAHLTEVSEYGDERDLESFLQTLSESHPERLYLYESTANGFNHFHEMWKGAKLDQHTQLASFIGWWARDDQRIPKKDPRYKTFMGDPWNAEERELRDIVAREYGVVVSDEQLAWYRWRSETKSFDEGMMHQSQPWTEKQAFVLSGRSFFPLRKVEKELDIVKDGKSVWFKAYRYYLGNDFTTTNIEQVTSLAETDLRVWEEPVPWGRYAIGCDPAYGRADWNDSHAIAVYRCYADRLIQVAEYGSTEPETFQVTWALAHIASIYTDCCVNFEISGPGIVIKTTLDQMRLLLRSNAWSEIVAKRNWQNVVDGIRWYLYHRPDSMGRGFAYGTKLNADLKIAIMNELRDSYTNGNVGIRSAQCLEQMQFIVQDGADIGPAAKGRKHDDFVFSTAYAHRAWLEWIRPEMISTNQTYAQVCADEKRMAEGKRPDAVKSVVTQFFVNQAEARKDAENNAWHLQRGLRT